MRLPGYSTPEVDAGVRWWGHIAYHPQPSLHRLSTALPIFVVVLFYHAPQCIANWTHGRLAARDLRAGFRRTLPLLPFAVALLLLRSCTVVYLYTDLRLARGSCSKWTTMDHDGSAYGMIVISAFLRLSAQAGKRVRGSIACFSVT